jgi:hypothetical protein
MNDYHSAAFSLPPPLSWRGGSTLASMGCRRGNGCCYRAMGLCDCNGGNGRGGVDVATLSLVGFIGTLGAVGHALHGIYEFFIFVYVFNNFFISLPALA